MKDIRKFMTTAVVGLAAVYAGYLVSRTVHPPVVSTAMKGTKTVPVGLHPGDMAPNFTLVTATGRSVTLSSLRGRGVWLNFWATWCPYCQAELPIVEQEQRVYGAHVDIIGVDVQESAGTVKKFAQRHGLTYPMALDSEGAMSAAYGVTGLPTSFFIASNGKIAAVYTGSLQNISTADQYLSQVIKPSIS